MDHKVSKDMISSGMIPSGEKTQADLSRTQYGSAPSPSKLMDAYKSMYDKKEEVINEHHQKDKDGNTIPHEGEELNELKSRTMLDYIDKASDSASKELDKAEKTTSRKKEVKARLKMDKRERGIEMAKDKIMKRVTEEVDKFDVVFNHFISEGYSEKEAYAKMANLTEEQLDEFLQALAPLAKGMMAGAVKVGAKAKPMATALAKQGKAMTKVDAIAKAKPKVSPGQMSLDLKGAGMKSTPQKSFSASSPSQVVDPKENLRARTGGNQFGDEVKRQATQAAINKAMSGSGGGQKERAKNISASADLFDIVKGQLLDEGLSEEEIKDIMLTLTPDEILKEIEEETGVSGGGSGGHYSDGGDGVFRSKEDVARKFNKNFPPAKNGKVDKKMRSAINTSAKDFGIQGPSTLKQSVEPKGETI